MIEIIKSVIKKTPLEPAARWVYTRFSSSLNARYDRETLAVMKKRLKRDSNCIDAGAHSGEVLKLILKCAPDGRHHAFEPLPDLYEGLLKNFSGVKVSSTALSDYTGESTFQYVRSRPTHSGLKERDYPDEKAEVEQITVNVDRLDNVIPPELKIDFIKIDVEGAEYNLLKGAVEMVKRSRPVIVFEYGLGAAEYYDEATPENVFGLLTGECGLKLSLMSRWLKNERSLDEAEFVKEFNANTNYYFIAYP
jgi:FkbM family methyltransferase